jgi:hypothetical protein
MTKDEIIEMVMQIGGCDRPEDDSPALKMFVAFAKLVAEREREACAGPDYERGFVDGMQKQMQSSVDKAVNAMAQPKQGDPVAYFNPQVKGGFYWAKPTKITAPVTVSVEPIPFYTHPPQRPWVGLTDEELKHIADSEWEEAFVRLIEARLKDKNT